MSAPRPDRDHTEPLTSTGWRRRRTLTRVGNVVVGVVVIGGAIAGVLAILFYDPNASVNMNPPTALHSLPKSASTDEAGTVTVHVSYQCPETQPQSYLMAYIDRANQFNESGQAPASCDGTEHTTDITISATYSAGKAHVRVSLWSLSVPGPQLSTYTRATTSATYLNLTRS